ncbi:MAG: hypothetical protein IJZ57_10005 [Clostridia bacterium]|nr:hypothetical protein [Clostridia bacterium]
MFEVFENRKTNPGKEKVVRDIVKFFAHGVEITKGEIKVYESADDDGVAWVRIDTGFIIEFGAGLQKLSEICNELYYLNIEPKGDKIRIYVAVEDVFEK